MAGPKIIRDAHLPEQVVLDTYGNGGFRFADMSHRGSLLCLPSGMYGWDVREGMPLDASHFQRVVEDAETIGFLLVGMGKDIRLLDAPLRAMMRDLDISVDPMSTGAAVRTYNIMLDEKRPVAAALIAV